MNIQHSIFNISATGGPACGWQYRICRIVLFAAAMMMSVSAHAGETLRLATTTSTYETGLLDDILPQFEKDNDLKVHVISVGTGKAIKLAENGDVDVILVHARKAEDKFVEKGFGVNRRDVMYNDFVILGPKDDPANVKGMKDAGDALKTILRRESTFVSRGDDSGTHKKEKSLWEAADVKPEGDWYLEAGQGMSATLRMADEKDGYVLVDRATYLANRKTLRLEIVVEGDSKLMNPYGIIAVNPATHKHAKYKQAMALIAYITSAECQKNIAEFKKEGETLFKPNANGELEDEK